MGWFKPVALMSQGHGPSKADPDHVEVTEVWHHINSKRPVFDTFIRTGTDITRAFIETADRVAIRRLGESMLRFIVRIEQAGGRGLPDAIGNPLSRLFELYLSGREVLTRLSSPSFRALDRASFDGKPLADYTTTQLLGSIRRLWSDLCHEPDERLQKEKSDNLEGLLVYLEVREEIDAVRQQRRNIRHVRELSELHPRYAEFWYRLRADEISRVERMLLHGGSHQSMKTLERTIEAMNRQTERRDPESGDQPRRLGSIRRRDPSVKPIVLDITADGRLLILERGDRLALVTSAEYEPRLRREILGGGGPSESSSEVEILPHADDARLRIIEVVCGRHLDAEQRSRVLRVHHALLDGSMSLEKAEALLLESDFDERSLWGPSSRDGHAGDRDTHQGILGCGLLGKRWK